MRSFRQQSILNKVETALADPALAVITPDGLVHVHENQAANYIMGMVQAVGEGLCDALEPFDPVVKVTMVQQPALDPEEEAEGGAVAPSEEFDAYGKRVS